MKFALALALLSSVPLVSHAATVQFQYKSTILYAVPNANIEVGDDFFITISLDNGGGLENGVWLREHVETIHYQVGAGTFSYTFDTSDPSLRWNESSDAGQFSTDENGALVSVPSHWGGIDSNGIYFINGDNGTFYSRNIALSLYDSNVENNIKVEGWSVVAVPEPSAALLGGLGVLAMLRRR